MRIPTHLLRETIAVQDFTGSGAKGPTYAVSRSLRASVQATSRLVTDATGRTVTVDLVALVRPEKGPVPVESRVTWAGSAYRVVQAVPMPDSRRPTHYELGLMRYAG